MKNECAPYSPQSTKHCQFSSARDEYRNQPDQTSESPRFPFYTELVPQDILRCKEETSKYLHDLYQKEQQELKDQILGLAEDDSFSYDRYKHTELRDAAWFCELFRPYHQRYTIEYKTAEGSDWKMINKKLKYQYIQNAIDKGKGYGWLCPPRTTVIGLDFDFHDDPGGGWTNKSTPRKILKDKYYEAISRCQHRNQIAVFHRNGIAGSGLKGSQRLPFSSGPSFGMNLLAG